MNFRAPQREFEQTARRSIGQESAADLEITKSLLALLYRPKRSVPEELRHFEWGRLPRFRAQMPTELATAPAGEFVAAARRILEQAIPDLRIRSRRYEDGGSPPEVLRLHVLEGLKWERIIEQRAQQGLVPLSEKTLKNRQAEGFRELTAWGSREPPVADQNRRTIRFPLAAFTLLLAIGVVLGVGWGARSNPSSDEVLRVQTGVSVGVYGQSELADLWPEHALPALGSPLCTAMAVPRASSPTSKYGLLLAGRKHGGAPGSLVYWLPDADRIVWKLVYSPPPEQVLTHKSLETEARLEAFEVPYMIFGSPDVNGPNLDDRIAAIYRQRFSPTFVVFVQLSSGEVLGSYAHPGHLTCGIVADLGEDGRTELVLGGTDNVYNAPSLVVIDPKMGVGSSASVEWNSGGEAALCHVYLPDVPNARRALGVEPRLRVTDVTLIDSSLGMVRASVGFADACVYVAYISPLEGAVRLSGDERSERRWASLGIDMRRLYSELEEQVRFVARSASAPRR